MNEKLQYACMLDIPVNTCNITYKPTKKRLSKKVNDDIKEKVVKKVNSKVEREKEQEDSDISLKDIEKTIKNKIDAQSDLQNQDYAKNKTVDIKEESVNREQEDLPITSNIKKGKIRQRKKINMPIKFSVEGLGLAVVCILVAIILITNAVNSNSGINTFMRSVFGAQSQTSDTREYSEFAPVVSVVSGEDGGDGILMLNLGSTYTPCEGVVESIEKSEDNGLYSITIKHSDNFYSYFTGLDYVYCEQGDNVYQTIPIGFIKNEGATLCFEGANGEFITGYTLMGNAVKWAV